MKIWCVDGIDDLEWNTFAFCSSEKTATKAKELLENYAGLENMLEIKESNLELDMIMIKGEKIFIKENKTRTIQQEYEKIKEAFEILSKEMDDRDEDCASPKNAVDKGYSLAVKHMKEQINEILSNIRFNQIA